MTLKVPASESGKVAVFRGRLQTLVTARSPQDLGRGGSRLSGLQVP